MNGVESDQVNSDRAESDRTTVGSRLSESEVAALVQRAVEIDTHRGGAADLDLEAVRQVVADVGVSEEAFSQALAEWRTGTLVPPRSARAAGARGVSTRAVAERLVPLTPPASAARLDAVLHKQCFDRIRRLGADSEYVRRRGLIADLQRGLNVKGQMRLKDVHRLVATVQPSGDLGSRVRVSVDLHSYRVATVAGAIGGPLAAGSAVALASIPGPEFLLLGLPAGLAVSVGGWVGARWALQARRARVEDALAAVLDRLG